ncbi:hypothetical protein FOZ62_025287, partial [Perkinsus olseni]
MSSFGGDGGRTDEERLRVIGRRHSLLGTAELFIPAQRRSEPYRPLAVLADPEFLGKRRYREMNLLWRDIVRRTRQEKIRQAEGDEPGCDERTTDDLLERVLRTGSSMDVLDSLPHMSPRSDPSPSPAAPTSSEGSIDGRSLQPGDISFEGPTRPFTPQPRRVLSPVRLQKRPRVACRTSASRAAERVRRRRSSLGSPGLSLGLRDYCDIDSDGEEATNSAGVSGSNTLAASKTDDQSGSIFSNVANPTAEPAGQPS